MNSNDQREKLRLAMLKAAADVEQAKKHYESVQAKATAAREEFYTFNEREQIVLARDRQRQQDAERATNQLAREEKKRELEQVFGPNLTVVSNL